MQFLEFKQVNTTLTIAKNLNKQLFTLRGGGCGSIGSTNVEEFKSSFFPGLPNNLATKLKEYTNTLVEKASLLMDENQKEEIMIAIQWFYFNQQHFNTLCFQFDKASRVYSLLLECLDNLLKSAQTYLRGSGFLCIQILQICNDLMRVVFSFSMNDKNSSNRYLEDSYKLQLQQYISSFEDLLENEAANVWVVGIEFELQILRTALEHVQSNSKQNEELIKNFLSEIFKSVTSLSLSDDLIGSIIALATKQLQDFYNKYYKNRIRFYKIYYFFETFKWVVVNSLIYQPSIPAKKLMDQLVQNYSDYIKDSRDWLVHYCWIKMISDLATYRPIISKENFKTGEKLEQWNSMILDKEIIVLSYSNQHARVLFKESLKNIFQTKEENPNQRLFKFFQQLMNQETLNEKNKIRLWTDYLRFSFNNRKQESEAQISLKQLFFGSQEIEIFRIQNKYLSQLLTESEDLDKQIQQQFQNFSKETKITEDIKNSYSNEIGTLLECLKEKLNQILELVFLIKFSSSLFVEKCSFFQQYLKKKEQQSQDNKADTKIFGVTDMEKEHKVQVDAINNFIDLYPKLIESLTKLELGNDEIVALHSEQEKIKELLKLNTNQFQTSLKTVKKASRSFTKQIIQIQVQNLEFLNQNKIQEKVSFLSTQFKVHIENISNHFFKSIPEFIQQALKNLKSNFFFEIKPDQCPSEKEYVSKKQQYFNYSRIFINFCQILPKLFKIFQHLAKQSADGLKILQKKEQLSINQNTTDPSLNSDILKQIKELIKKQEKDLQNFLESNSNYLEQDIQNQINKIKKDIDAIKIRQKQVNLDQFYVNFCEKLNYLLLQMQIEKQQQTKFKEQIFLEYKEFWVSKQNQEQTDSENKQKQASSQSTNQSSNNKDNRCDQKEIEKQNTTQSLQNQFETSLNGLIIITKHLAEIHNLSSSSFQSNYNEFIIFLKKSQEQFDQRYKAFEQIIESLKVKQAHNDILTKIQEKLFILEIQQYFQILNSYECQQILLKTDEEQDEILEFIGNKLQASSYEKIEKQDSNNNDHKVKECLVFYLIKMQSVVSEQKIINFCQNLTQQIWGLESDDRVKKLLKNKEMIDLQKKMFSSDLLSFSKRLQQDINQRLDQLNKLEFQIGQEVIQQRRQQLQKDLDQQYQEFDQYLDGITDMASKLDLSLLFLKDIRKQFSQIKAKIDLISSSIIDIGKDLRKLKGKNYYDLLMMRRETVLEQKQQFDMRSVYIILQTQEWDPKTGLKIAGQNKDGTKKDETTFISDDLDDLESEVNQFLYHENDKMKDVMLIRGFAGSGKSRGAKKIEEFLWENYDKVEQKKRKKWTPIFVSLPTLREPRFNLFTQALESDFYKFDKIQIREFLTDIQNKKLNIVLILDSYDEMKSEIIQKNLYLTNSLNLEFSLKNEFIKQGSEKQFKIIITTRSEILLSKSYQTWFCGFDVSTMKEVELLSFNENQKFDYLKIFTELNIKKFILEMYEFFLQMQNRQFQNEEFQQIWKNILSIFQNEDQQSNDLLLDKNQIYRIIKEINQNILFKNANQQYLQNLTKELGSLWSIKKYQKAINNVSINNLLTTPFMMEIVVQVLPNMIQDFSKVSVLKDNFLKNYVQVKLISLKQERKIERYKNKAANKSKEAKQYPKESDLEVQAKNLWETLEKKNIFNDFSIDNDYKTEQSNQISIANEIFEVGQEAKIIIRTLKQHQLTNYDFYYFFVEFYHKKQMQKQKQLGRGYNFESLSIDLIQYCQSLALEMTKNQLTQVIFRVKGQLNIKYLQNQENLSWKDIYFSDFQGDGNYKKMIRSCTLLHQKGNNFSFTHKSIQEFYVAKYFIEQLEQFKLIDDDKFKKFMENYITIKKVTRNEVFKYYQEHSLFKDDFTLDDFDLIWQQYFVTVKDGIWNQPEFNLSLETFRGCLKLMRFKLKQINKLKPILLQQIQLSRYDDIFINAASNSIFILTFINEYFGKDDLSQIKISNTKLNGASFFMANLSESKFINVDINSCNFNCANLNKVDWKKFNFLNTQNFEGHKQKINDIKLIQKKYLISCSNDEQIIFWNLKTQEVIQTLVYHTKQVTALCVFDDENQFASVGLDKQIITYQIDGNKIKMITNHFCEEPLFSIAFFKRQNIFIVGGNKLFQILLYNDKKLSKEENLETHEKIQSLCVSSDNEFIAAGFGKVIKLFGSDEQDLESHQDTILALQFFQDNSYLASGGADKIINIWDMNDYKLVQTISDNVAAIQSISIFTEQNNLTKLAYGDGKCIKIFDVQAGKTINKIEGRANIITAVMLANSEKNEKFVVFGSDIGVMRTLSVENQENYLSNLEGHSQEVTSVSFSPDGYFVASGSYDKTIKIWETRTGKQVADLTLHTSRITQVLFSPNGEILASISEGRYIYFWDAKTYQLLKQIDRNVVTTSSKDTQKNGKDANVSTSTIYKFTKSNLDTSILEYSEKHQLLLFKEINDQNDYLFVAGSLEGKILAAKKDSNQLEFLYNHKTAVYALDWAKGTKTIGSGCLDGEIIIWSLVQNIIIYTLQLRRPILALAMLPDTFEFVTGLQDGIVKIYKEDQKVKEWKLGDEDITSIQISAKTSQAFVGSLDCSAYQINLDQSEAKLFKEEVVLQVLQISTQRKYLATSKDSSINLWDLSNNSFKARLKAHVEEVSSICFSDNDEIMASGGADDVIHIWNLKTKVPKLMGTLYGHSSTITKVEFQLNDKKEQILISSSKDSTIRIWDIKEFEQILILQYQVKQIISFEFFNKKQWLASASQDKTVAIIDIENGKLEKLLKENNKIQSLTISIDDKNLAVSYEDLSINIYSTEKNWTINSDVKINYQVFKIQFSYCQKDILYLQDEDSFAEYNLSDQKLVYLIQDFEQSDFSLCKTKNCMAYFNKTSLVIKDLELSKDEYLLEAKQSAITALAISQNGEYFSTGKTDGMITIWHIRNQYYYNLKKHENKIIFLQFIGDDELISAGWDNTILQWKFLQKDKPPIKLQNFDTKISDVTIIDNTTFIVSTLKDAFNDTQNLSFGAFQSKGDVFVFRSQDGKLKFINPKINYTDANVFQKARDQNATAVAFSKNDEFFAYGNGEGNIICLKKNEVIQLPVKHKKQITALTFANKEKLLASGSADMVVYVCNYENKSLLHTIMELNELHKSINSIAFWIDDSMLCIGGELKNILFYQLDSSKTKSQKSHFFLEGHILGINAVEFSPSGNKLVSASKDFCIKLWKLKKEKTDQPDVSQKSDKPDKQNIEQKDVTNPSEEEQKIPAIEQFQNKIFCYKTIGLNYSFEANDVKLDGASIKNNENESLEKNFQKS